MILNILLTLITGTLSGKRLKTHEVKFWSLAEKLNRPLGKG